MLSRLIVPPLVVVVAVTIGAVCVPTHTAQRRPAHPLPSPAAGVPGVRALQAEPMQAAAATHRATRVAASPFTSWPHPWRELAWCESGRDGSWRVSSASKYRGYLQFDYPTWRSVGGIGDPARATAAEQLRRARALHALRGWLPWPQCSRQLSLR